MQSNLIASIKFLFPKLPFSILTSSREDPLGFDFHFTLMRKLHRASRLVYLWLCMKSFQIPEVLVKSSILSLFC